MAAIKRDDWEPGGGESVRHEGSRDSGADDRNVAATVACKMRWHLAQSVAQQPEGAR